MVNRRKPVPQGGAPIPDALEAANATPVAPEPAASDSETDDSDEDASDAMSDEGADPAPASAETVEPGAPPVAEIPAMASILSVGTVAADTVPPEPVVRPLSDLNANPVPQPVEVDPVPAIDKTPDAFKPALRVEPGVAPEPAVSESETGPTIGRVLVEFEGHQVNDLYRGSPNQVETRRLAGQIDTNPDAVAAARALVD